MPIREPEDRARRARDALPAADRRSSAEAHILDRQIAVTIGVTRTAVKWRSPAWPIFLIGFALLGLGLLIGPRVPDRDAGYNCIGNVDLEGPFGFGLNCDSPEFMWLARDPAGLVDHVNSRQSRPGLVLLAAAIQAPLALLLPPAGPPTPVYQGLYDPLRVAESFIQDRPAYFAYILLNVAILLASFFALRLAVEHDQPVRSTSAAVIVAATGVLLIANDVTKAFFWSPHTQMFNILVPVLAVYATQRVFARGRLDRSFALAMGAVIGLGMTAYPFFVVIAACMLPPAALGVWRAASTIARRRNLTNVAILLVLGAVPSAAWYVYVRATSGGFFAAELNLHQVVWMKDALAQGLGVFLAKWFGYLGELLGFAAPQALGLAILIGWLIAGVGAALWTRRIALANLAPAIPMIAIGLYVSLAVLGFYTCVGWITERLAYPMIPPLLIAAGATAVTIAQRLAPRSRAVLAGGCLAIAAAQVIYEVAKQGPWS
jgi:hypothetical protein